MSTPQRHAVLIVASSDGFIEIFADRNIDFHVAQMPAASTARGERIAEACLERMIPRRFRDLFRRDRLRANAIVRSVTPEATLAAMATRDTVRALNRLQDAREGDAA